MRVTAGSVREIAGNGITYAIVHASRRGHACHSTPFCKMAAMDLEALGGIEWPLRDQREE